MRRVILIVLDSAGIGSLPDAHLYGDDGSNTLGHILDKRPGTKIPNLISMGLGNIDFTNTVPKTGNPIASYGKAAERSAGKDTTTGHWEIAGNILKKAFPTFPNGFPADFIAGFEKRIGRRTIGNITASGTEIINRLGDEHVKTGKPIIYTSSDSVFQIAMHEDIIPIEEQYHICRLAREMLTEDLEVGRVIARPFIGKAGQYQRTSRRKDFAIMPPYNMLNAIVDDGKSVLAIGKISDIFAGSGISESVKTDNNAEGMKATIQAMDSFGRGLIFTNLVDFDMHYGHRRDVEGYALCLEEFDTFLPKLFSKLEGDDLLIVTADHGNDPTWHGTDHTREYIPILIYNRLQQTSINFGIRNSFADIAATVLDALGTKFATDSIAGESISYIW